MVDRYVDVTTGDDGDSGATEALAWQTLGFAANTIADGETCYVKASASYVVDDPDDATVCWDITTAGSEATPVVWIGYTTVITDGGLVTVDADVNTNVSAMTTSVGGNVYNVFKNFRFTGGSGVGVSLNSSADDAVTFKNCRFDNNDGVGLQGDNRVYVENCLFDNNGGNGFEADYYCIIIGCISHSNSGYGFDAQNATTYASISYANGTSSSLFHCNPGSLEAAVFINCVSDGDDGATTIGIFNDGNAASTMALVNCIFLDCNQGVRCDGGGTELNISRNNLYCSNGTDRTNWIEGEDDVTGGTDPFTASATRDYTLKYGSDAIDAGYDASQPTSDWGL